MLSINTAATLKRYKRYPGHYTIHFTPPTQPVTIYYMHPNIMSDKLWVNKLLFWEFWKTDIDYYLLFYTAQINK